MTSDISENCFLNYHAIAFPKLVLQCFHIHKCNGCITICLHNYM